nr:hypothetical protein GCM10020092_098600 [Actinoplanes digitatis]
MSAASAQVDTPAIVTTTAADSAPTATRRETNFMWAAPPRDRPTATANRGGQRTADLPEIHSTYQNARSRGIEQCEVVAYCSSMRTTKLIWTIVGAVTVVLLLAGVGIVAALRGGDDEPDPQAAPGPGAASALPTRRAPPAPHHRPAPTSPARWTCW